MAPTQALEALWKEYEAFENNTGNRQLAQRVLAEFRPKFLAAQATTAERLAMVNALDGNALAVPPGTCTLLPTRQPTHIICTHFSRLTMIVQRYSLQLLGSGAWPAF